MHGSTWQKRYLVWGAVALLLIFHQDYWQWSDSTLILGFLPRTLAYQVGISVVSAIVWLVATQVCWPVDELDLPQADSQEAQVK